MLQNLLEEIPRPVLKKQKTFNDHIHRWRCFLYRQWKSLKPNDISDKDIGDTVDHLIGLMLLLEHCKQSQYFNLELSQLTNTHQNETLGTLQRKIVDSIACPILKKVFAVNDDKNIIFPSSLLDDQCEKRIRNSTWLLIENSLIPIWLFGDYHQLCVANPHGQLGGRKRSSHIRYARGIHYTPAPIVDYLTTTVLNNEFQSDFQRILDPSCGCGSFLIAAFRYIVEKENNVSLNRTQNILKILGESLFGVDVDSQAIDWMIRLLYLECKRLIGTDEDNLASHLIPDISKILRKKRKGHQDLQFHSFLCALRALCETKKCSFIVLSEHFDKLSAFRQHIRRNRNANS